MTDEPTPTEPLTAETPSGIDDSDHHCRGSVKVYDYGTSYCDPDKGGCGMSRGVDGRWRGLAGESP